MAVLTQIAIADLRICGECGGCVPICPVNAIYLSPEYLSIDGQLCNGCGECVAICPVGAIRLIDG